MHAEGTQHALQSVLQQQACCSGLLLETLEEERTALLQRDSDALELAVAKKLEHTQLLEKLDRQREQILADLGFATDQAGMKQCFEVLPGKVELEALWQRIMGNIRKCQDGNRTNGGILEAGRQHVDQALRILRGQHGAASLYNPLGETTADLGRRELGKV